jgi:ribulose-phosphate 3-epimerase
LLAANFLKLGEECKMINESEAEWLHLDVMDGRFVPNISYGIRLLSMFERQHQKFAMCI